MRYELKRVDRIPRELEPGIVYHSQEYELGALLCACGCGHRINLLVPDSHRIFSDSGSVTVRPSILVADGACLSHYFITAGEVEWSYAFSSAQARNVMQRQVARHVEADTKAVSTWVRLWNRVKRFAYSIGRIFTR
jgi:hypothetical protein